ncbi:MAG: lipase [Clostridia bacterium]|nr:lipase [Clostridia bacterium]
MSDRHWTSIWGNAVSVAENRPERYAKNITIRYPIRVPFDGTALRLTFDNYCGTEPVTINKTTLLVRGETLSVTCGDSSPEGGAFWPVTFSGNRAVTIGAGETVTSDPIAVNLRAGETVHVSFYLADFTLMRSVVFTCGKRSGGLYANGDETENADISIHTSRQTKLNYFLSNVSILTAPENRCIVCYGDSITAQDWPDDLQIRCEREGFTRTAIIRRAASGTRILREYTCLTYESYGLMGSRRFLHEVPTDGADAVIIQQGINDIIHPVGEEVNIFRPMSDLPTVDELIEGLKTYIAQAREMGLRVYVGTLIPMGGWRTDAPFRQEMRHAYNDFIHQAALDGLIDGCIDFDAALRDPARPDWFLPEYDSGDHLHPSKKGYERMAEEVPAELLR